MQNTAITHVPLTSDALGLEGEEDSLVEVLVIGESAAKRRGHPPMAAATRPKTPRELIVMASLGP
jgi:hypothetical protein